MNPNKPIKHQYPLRPDISQDETGSTMLSCSENPAISANLQLHPALIILAEHSQPHQPTHHGSCCLTELGLIFLTD
jgi:hypothetical protein